MCEKLILKRLTFSAHQDTTVYKSSMTQHSDYECQHALTLYQALTFLFSIHEESDDCRNVCATSSSNRIKLIEKIVFIRLSSSQFDLELIMLSRCLTSSS